MTKSLVADNIRYKGFCYILEENEVKIIRILFQQKEGWYNGIIKKKNKNHISG